MLKFLFRYLPSAVHSKEHEEKLEDSDKKKEKLKLSQSFRSQFNLSSRNGSNEKEFSGQKFSNKEIYEHLSRNFKNMKGITPLRFWNYIWRQSLSYLTCCCRERDATARRYRKFVEKSESLLAKEMDLHKFVLRQRISALSALATLSSSQTYVIDKMS